jgi:mannose-6-phosphate isomerase
MTMDPKLPRVLDANAAYQRDGFHLAPRTPRPADQLVVLTCMDARIDLFRALGLEVGDAHILRNAGGRASIDAIRSLLVSTHLLDTREIGVIHHTNCGLEHRSDEEVAGRIGVTDLDFLTFDDVEASVLDDVGRIRGYGHFPPGTIVWGAVYDVDTGALRVVAEPGDADTGTEQGSERPWGRYRVLDDQPDHKVKRITVDPGKRLSYQRHSKRSEHWFVVAGRGVVTLDGASIPVEPGAAVDIPVETPHRIENPGSAPLVFVEVQHGSYFGEDDIVRLADDFGRAG